MSDTPRTDALTGTFYLRCDDCPQPDKCERMQSIHPDDARKIERKLTEAAAEIERLERERDDLRETLRHVVPASHTALYDASRLASKRADEAERQRDEAIAALRWIPVAERLPTKDDWYAVIQTQEPWAPSTLRWEGGWVWWNSDPVLSEDYVTHWMALPDPESARRLLNQKEGT